MRDLRYGLSSRNRLAACLTTAALCLISVRAEANDPFHEPYGDHQPRSESSPIGSSPAQLDGRIDVGEWSTDAWNAAPPLQGRAPASQNFDNEAYSWANANTPGVITVSQPFVDEPVESPLPEPDRIFLPPPPDEALITPVEELPFIVPYKGRFFGTWIPGSGNRLGVTSLESRLTLAFPRLQGFTITPGSGIHFLDGPSRTDMPPRLYENWLDISWMHQHSERFGYEIAVIPGYFSDFQRARGDGIRIQGRGLAFYQWTEEAQVVLGIVYLDRQDVRLLPAFGVIWTPHENARHEIVFPRPRLAWRFAQFGTMERWAYLGGEFGGNTFAVQRDVPVRPRPGLGRQPPSAFNDIATYSDWRFLAGIEQRHLNGPTLFFELGYVFNRRLEYRSKFGNYKPNDTLLGRIGVAF